ncbi:MAG: hypothetical protein ABL921_33640, partial [Pirellula sp.]
AIRELGKLFGELSGLNEGRFFLPPSLFRSLTGEHDLKRCKRVYSHFASWPSSIAFISSHAFDEPTNLPSGPIR